MQENGGEPTRSLQHWQIMSKMIRRCRLILRNQQPIVLCRRKRVKRDGEDDDDDVDFDYNEIDEGGDFEFVPDAEQAAERERGELRSDLHVIYRRKNSHLEHSSDYRKSRERGGRAHAEAKLLQIGLSNFKI